MPDSKPYSETFPRISNVGVDGCLVSFGKRFDEATNRAALAFRAVLQDAGLPGVAETSTSLTSTFLRIEARDLEVQDLYDRLDRLIGSRDWYDAPLPAGRRLWRVPCVFGGDLAPQFDATAAAAGVTKAEALASLQGARTRVLTIGFAPGQPYLGQLPEIWDVPRQKELTPQVPAGALVLAIRQLVLFSRPAPTGWRHIGQTAFENFRLDRDPAFALRPGDEMQFYAVEADELHDLAAADAQGFGGAQCRDIT